MFFVCEVDAGILDSSVIPKDLLMLTGRRTGNSESNANSEAKEVRISARATLSQQIVMKKLQQLQSKRAELINDRTKVRNYNIK